MESRNEGATNPIKAVDRSMILLDYINAEKVRTPFNFFRTPTMYVVVSLVDLTTGQKHQEQRTRSDRGDCFSTEMRFYLDGQDEAGLLLVFEPILHYKGGDFSVGNASFPISELMVRKSFFSTSPVLASSGKEKGTIYIRYRIAGNPEAEIPLPPQPNVDFVDRPLSSAASGVDHDPPPDPNPREFRLIDFEEDGGLGSTIANSSESELVSAPKQVLSNPEVRGRQNQTDDACSDVLEDGSSSHNISTPDLPRLAPASGVDLPPPASPAVGSSHNQDPPPDLDGRRDKADLAHIVETVCKSFRRESASMEDHEFIVDTAVGRIDLSNLQEIDNEDLEEIKELGSGAFGTVYAGKWCGSNVAIKRLNSSRFTSQQDRLILQFLKEAAILSKLNHPNVVRLFGFVQENGKFSIVTELVANGSLRDFLHHEHKNLSHHRKLVIAYGAASGMKYLHSKKIVHFDLKCDNLLVDLKDPSSPICKVADFGLSKVKLDSVVSGGFRGTVRWMAPELFKWDGSYVVSDKVDVFSFGIVMWEILTGEVPYDGMHDIQIYDGVSKNILRPPVPTSCEPQWRELMEKCWEFDPQKRPSFIEIYTKLHSMLVSNLAKVGR